MNKMLERALKMDEFNNKLPKLEVGDIVTLGEVWDGEGETPVNSYSYKLTDTDWINYEFKIINKHEDELDTEVKIINKHEDELDTEVKIINIDLI